MYTKIQVLKDNISTHYFDKNSKNKYKNRVILDAHKDRKFKYVAKFLTFTLLPDSWIVFILKSTPMVPICDVVNIPSANLKIKLDLPTPASPMQTTLQR
jgi:hypothetical protein